MWPTGLRKEVVSGQHPILHRDEGRDVVHRVEPAGKQSALHMSHTHTPCMAPYGPEPVSFTEILVQPMFLFWFQCCFRFLGKKQKVTGNTLVSCSRPLFEVFHMYPMVTANSLACPYTNPWAPTKVMSERDEVQINFKYKNYICYSKNASHWQVNAEFNLHIQCLFQLYNSLSGYSQNPHDILYLSKTSAVIRIFLALFSYTTWCNREQIEGSLNSGQDSD